MVDRDLQKRGVFSGIRGVNTQDFALQEGMGAIVDRSKEFLGSTDKAIVTLRRLLLEATGMVENGEAPRGLDPDKHGNIRAHDDLLPQTVDWRERFAQDALARW
jgi:hypothetical protein